MKTLLISAASLIFISGTAFAREVILTPSVPFHGASAHAEHRAARLESPVREGAVFCCMSRRLAAMAAAPLANP
jgi:hypothetical protein